MSHAAFLNAIRAAPDDVAARLVYADYLDEQGGRADADRAEFIRLQTRLAELDEADRTGPHSPANGGSPGAVWAADRDALEDRENELLRANERAWLGPLSGPLARGLTGWRFERGFVTRVDVDTKTLCHHGTSLFGQHPIAAVRLEPPDSDSPGPLDKLATKAWWDRVRDLRVGEFTTATVAAFDGLLTSPALAGLRRLSLNPSEERNAPPRLPDVLARAPWLGTLDELHVRHWPHDAAELVPALGESGARTLRLSGCRFTGRDLAAVLSRPGLRRVELADGNLGGHLWGALKDRRARPVLGRVSLTGVDRGTDVDLPTLLSAPASANLEAVDAGETRLSNTKVRAFATTGFMARASEIGLTRCHVNAKTMAALAAAPAPRLRVLKLGETGLHTAGVRALCAADWCANLTHLDLMRNYLDDDALVELAGCGKFTSLRSLDLRVNSPYLARDCTAEIGDRGVIALAAAPSLSRLRHLNLYRTRITAKGVDAVLNGPHWRLTELDLGGYDLGPGLVEVLAKSPRLQRLTRLSLSFTPALGGDALLPLAESPYLSPLCELDVGYNDVSDRVRARLAQRLTRRLKIYPAVGSW